MNKELLLQIFKAPYNRQSFIENVLLPTVQGKVDGLEIYDQHGAQEVDLTVSEEQYAKSAVKYGEFTTRDEIGRTVELYEVVLHDHKATICAQAEDPGDSSPRRFELDWRELLGRWIQRKNRDGGGEAKVGGP